MIGDLAPDWITLTQQEWRVVEAMAECGLSTRGLAHHFTVSKKTIETHLANIYQKFHLIHDKQSPRLCLIILYWKRKHTRQQQFGAYDAKNTTAQTFGHCTGHALDNLEYTEAGQ